MSSEMHGTGAANLVLALAIPDASFYARGLLHPLLDNDAPKGDQNRIDDEMDANGYGPGRSAPG